jgi:upstream activation factor subunit UAF30
LLPSVDLGQMGLKQFIGVLSQSLGGVDLKPQKAFIKQALTEAINDLENQDTEHDDSREDQEGDDEAEDDHEEDDEDEEEDGDDDTGYQPGAKAKRGSGLNAPKAISPKLAAFLKQGPEMSRPAIVKELWSYIRENNLQNPADKREIILDDALYQVFGVKSFTMFSMNKVFIVVGLVL